MGNASPRLVMLAAGQGTRLKPLTDAIPKAMQPIDGEPLLLRTLRQLLRLGFASATVVDVAVSSGVFCYFSSLDYARSVLERMAAKAGRAVLILDLPDSARRVDALAHRVAAVGGAEAYASRYAGVDHLYYSRDWASDALRSCGLYDVRVVDQSIAEYENSRFRFNAWGFKSPQRV